VIAQQLSAAGNERARLVSGRQGVDSTDARFDLVVSDRAEFEGVMQLRTELSILRSRTTAQAA